MKILKLKKRTLRKFKNYSSIAFTLLVLSFYQSFMLGIVCIFFNGINALSGSLLLFLITLSFIGIILLSDVIAKKVKDK